MSEKYYTQEQDTIPPKEKKSFIESFKQKLLGLSLVGLSFLSSAGFAEISASAPQNIKPTIEKIKAGQAPTTKESRDMFAACRGYIDTLKFDLRTNYFQAFNADGKPCSIALPFGSATAKPIKGDKMGWTPTTGGKFYTSEKLQSKDQINPSFYSKKNTTIFPFTATKDQFGVWQNLAIHSVENESAFGKVSHGCIRIGKEIFIFLQTKIRLATVDAQGNQYGGTLIEINDTGKITPEQALSMGLPIFDESVLKYNDKQRVIYSSNTIGGNSQPPRNNIVNFNPIAMTSKIAPTIGTPKKYIEPLV